MNYFVIACLLIFLGIMLYMDIIKHFIGPRFHEGLAVVPILLLANMFLGIYWNLSIWYKLTSKTMYGASFAIAGALITIVLNIWWIPHFGYHAPHGPPSCATSPSPAFHTSSAENTTKYPTTCHAYSW